MFPQEHMFRLLCSEFSVTQSQLLSVKGAPPLQIDTKQINSYLRKFDNKPVYFRSISSNVDVALETVRSIYYEQKAKLNPNDEPRKNPWIVNVWDHARLFSSNNEKDELERLTKLSQGFVRLEKEIKCTDIMLSQLNRNIEGVERAKTQYQPLLSDLYGSDSIGQDASCVMIINRPFDMYGITQPYNGENPKGLLALHVEKSRFGPLGLIPFELDSAKFSLKER
jgi:replicative DNA helicase